MVVVVMGSTPYNSQNGVVCERKGVSPVEVYERIVKSVIVVSTRSHKMRLLALLGLRKTKITFWLGDLFMCKRKCSL